jgi:hypothetical protein
MSTNFSLAGTLPHLRRPSALAAAAVAYPVAWLAGLMVPVPATDLDAPAAAVSAALSGREAAFALRELLVHGLAGVLLAVVVLACAGGGRSLRVAGLTAAGLSLVQFGLALALASGADGSLMHAVNVLDGAKMLALAAVGALAVRNGLLGRRTRALAVAMSATITVSGLGYLLTLPALAPAAYLSLPLLLATIAAMGVGAARR